MSWTDVFVPLLVVIPLSALILASLLALLLCIRDGLDSLYPSELGIALLGATVSCIVLAGAITGLIFYIPVTALR